MAKILKITGDDVIKKNMKMYGDKLGKRMSNGLKKAGTFLQAESMKIVPVNISNLKGSAFTRKLGSGMRTDVVVGYTAAYAIYVHEMVEKLHGKDFNVNYADRIAAAKGTKSAKYWHDRGEKQQAKFLEQPARNKRKGMIHIIVDEIRRGKK